MNPLAPCVRCSRAIRAGVCPFCGGARGAVRATTFGPARQRAIYVAALALGGTAGCGSGQPIYGFVCSASDLCQVDDAATAGEVELLAPGDASLPLPIDAASTRDVEADLDAATQDERTAADAREESVDGSRE